MRVKSEARKIGRRQLEKKQVTSTFYADEDTSPVQFLICIRGVFRNKVRKRIKNIMTLSYGDRRDIFKCL